MIRAGLTCKPIRVAEGLTEAEAYAEEMRLIAQHGRQDLGTGPLLNFTDGGSGLRNPAHHVRDAMSAPQRGKKRSAEAMAKLRAAIFGRKRDAGVTRRFVQNCTLSGQGLEHRTNLA